MSYQTSFADLDYTHKKRLTRREVFLNEMEQTVPWLKLIALIEPAYPTTGRRERQPMPLASMQRHYDALVSAELENRLAAMPDS